MASFQQQLSRPSPRRSREGASRPHAPSPTPARVTSPAPQSQQVQVSAAGPSSHLEKRRWSEGIGLANPLAVNPGSIMAVIRGATREAMVEEVVGRMTKIMAF